MKYTINYPEEYADVVSLIYGTTPDKLVFIDGNHSNLKTSNVIVV